MPSKVDGILLGYLPTQGTLELKHISTNGTSCYSFSPDLRKATVADCKRFINLIGCIVRVYLCSESWEVDRIEEIKSRQAWLDELKAGDKVLFTRNNGKPRTLLIRIIDSGHVCMIDANNPKGDLAAGEVVWLEHGEGPFGERIDPLDLME